MPVTCRLSGRTGNNLFQIAATYALAKDLGVDYFIPNDTYWYKLIPNNLEIELPYRDLLLPKEYIEPNFSYNDLPLEDNLRLVGYYQSYKYFDKYKEDIKDLFLDFKLSKNAITLINKIPNNSVCISVRRGDFVDNKNYAQLSEAYYNYAYRKYFKGQDCIVFSDDISWCKKNLDLPRNVYYVENISPFSQIGIAVMCSDFIISNSTFSWWMAYLGETETSKIIRPKNHFAGKLLKNDIKDHYPKNWIPYEN